MQFVVPDLLAEVCGLSVALCLTGLLVGLALWLFGWRGHRFWIVLLTTVLGGILTLCETTIHGGQPLLTALLVAVTAGLLALALVQLLAFGAGGGAGLLLLHYLLPSWNQPLFAFLLGGLLGLLLFRLWLMALTSLAGALLLSYCGLALLHHYGTLDAPACAEQGQVLLNWTCCLLALVGWLLQFFLDRRLRARHQEEEEPALGWDLAGWFRRLGYPFPRRRRFPF